MSDRGGDRRWLDDPRNVTRLVWGLVVACLGLAAADFFYAKYTHFGWEEWPAVYAIFGFAAFFFIVLAGKQLRKVLMRDEDYYDE